jgi:phage baseplate assembly protein gpV
MNEGVMKNLIRIGKVSSINYEGGKVRVVFPDKDNLVSSELPMLSAEYNIPEVGDAVLCIFLPNGITQGFCLGKFFSQKNIPREAGDGIYYKDFFGEAFARYDKSSKTLTLNAENIRVEGNLKIEGSITATGTITGSNIP